MNILENVMEKIIHENIENKTAYWSYFPKQEKVKYENLVKISRCKAMSWNCDNVTEMYRWSGMNKRVAETERGHMYVILLYGKNTLVKGDYAIEEKITSKIICGL